MQKKIRKKEQGFGIIEILIAIGLAGFFLTAFLSLTWQTVKINRANIKELQARMYLKELIEIARDLEQSDWELIAGCSPFCHPHTNDSNDAWALNVVGEDKELPGEPEEKQELEGGTYGRWLSVSEIDENIENIKKVEAEIEWHDGFKERKAKLETYIYNYDFE